MSFRRRLIICIVLITLGVGQILYLISTAIYKSKSKNSNPNGFVNQHLINPMERVLTDRLQETLLNPWNQEVIPVVQVHFQVGNGHKDHKHYIYRSLKKAREKNNLVYLIGPLEWLDMAEDLNITLDPYTSYQDTFDWFHSNIGEPITYQIRWFVLLSFMQRHGYARVFYSESDALLFANITQAVNMLYPHEHIVLSMRWPSLEPPEGPSQYPSVSVSGHFALWTYESLFDFLKFFHLFFQHTVLSGKKSDHNLVNLWRYNDMAILGWYTYQKCWKKKLHSPCLSDRESGFFNGRIARIRTKFTPKYNVSSFCEPKWCKDTAWSDEGWCVFDNGFSIQTPTQFFHYFPETGMKCPISMHYSYFSEWTNLTQADPIQFLGAHFHGYKKGYLSRWDDPSKTWGSSVD